MWVYCKIQSSQATACQLTCTWSTSGYRTLEEAQQSREQPQTQHAAKCFIPCIPFLRQSRRGGWQHVPKPVCFLAPWNKQILDVHWQKANISAPKHACDCQACGTFVALTNSQLNKRHSRSATLYQQGSTRQSYLATKNQFEELQESAATPREAARCSKNAGSRALYPQNAKCWQQS